MYIFFKVLHVIAVIMFVGNITVGGFWKAWGDRTKDPRIIANAVDGIIVADRIFTIPGIILLLIGGIGAALVGHIPILSTGWILWPIVLFIAVGDRLRSGRAGTALALCGRARRHRLRLDELGALPALLQRLGGVGDDRTHRAAHRRHHHDLETRAAGLSRVRVIQLCSGLLVRDGALLLTRCVYEGEPEPLWTLPGGRQEKGETKPQTIAREFWEEAALRVKVGRARVRERVDRCAARPARHECDVPRRGAWRARATALAGPESS